MDFLVTEQQPQEADDVMEAPLQETNHARRAALMVRLKRLKFADRQAQLQAMVEREQSELTNMTDRAYRAVARQCVRQRLDKMRAVRTALPPPPASMPCWRLPGTPSLGIPSVLHACTQPVPVPGQGSAQ